MSAGRASPLSAQHVRQHSDLGSSHTQTASRSSRCEGHRSGWEESQGRGRWIIKELGEKRRMLCREEWRHAIQIHRKWGFVLCDGSGTTCLSEKRSNRGESLWWLQMIKYILSIFFPPLHSVVDLHPLFELYPSNTCKCSNKVPGPQLAETRINWW